MEKLREVLARPGVRAALYALGAAVMGVLAALGVVDAAQAEQAQAVVERGVDVALDVLFAALFLLARNNTPKD